MSAPDATEFWDGVYAPRPAVTDPRPNVRLVEVVAGLTPGHALDLGSGGGGDAVWLARRGWLVTAVDVSAVAVSRLADLAGGLELTDAVSVEQHELGRSFPAGRFDLVSAHYLHTPLSLDRATVLRAAAHALRPGGTMLVVDHGSTAPWSWDQDPDAVFPSAREVADGLHLDPAGWTVERADAPHRIAAGPDGQTAEVVDHVLVVRRTSSSTD